MGSLRRFTIGVIMAIAIGAPILETVDRWDRTSQDGNETEFTLVVTALCVGAAFAVACVDVARLGAFMLSRGCRMPVTRSAVTMALTLGTPTPNSLPPTPLRI